MKLSSPTPNARLVHVEIIDGRPFNDARARCAAARPALLRLLALSSYRHRRCRELRRGG